MQVIVAKPKTKLSSALEYFLEHKFYFVLLLFLVLGMLCGAVTVKHLTPPYSDAVDNWVESFLNYRSSAAFWEVFFTCYLTAFAVILVICSFAFGVIGLPALPILLFLRGFGSCALAGELYAQFSLQGIAFANLILLPFCIVFDFIILYLSSMSMEISQQFWSVLTSGYDKLKLLRVNGIKMLKNSIVCSIMFIAIALLEAAFSVLFIKHFNFK